MSAIDISRSGTFRIASTTPVHRLGFGAMRITGQGVWGPPADEAEARAVLRRVVDLGIDLIDTADSYGPFVSETLIASTLSPYRPGLLIATKGGFTRPGPGSWVADGRPEYLRACVQGSVKRLGVERLGLWQLHRIDAKVPRDEQLAAVASFQKEGLIEHIGLSEVSVDDIREAQRHFRVATVQNLYNLVNRKSEAVLALCEQEGIGFIPWYPLAAGRLAGEGTILSRLSGRYGVSPSALALAWVLRRSPVMLPIPGTGKLAHLEENMAAASVVLSDADFAELDRLGQDEWRSSQRGG